MYFPEQNLNMVVPFLLYMYIKYNDVFLLQYLYTIVINRRRYSFFSFFFLVDRTLPVVRTSATAAHGVI